MMLLRYDENEVMVNFKPGVICRLGGEYSAPRAAFSRPRSQFFTIRTDPKPVNNLFFFFFCVKKNCFNFS